MGKEMLGKIEDPLLAAAEGVRSVPIQWKGPQAPSTLQAKPRDTKSSLLPGDASP
jgi:hypothetical protein